MIFLIILFVILALLLAVLFFPLDICVKFLNNFHLKIRFAGLKVFETKPKTLENDKNEDESSKNDDIPSKEKTSNTKELFSFLKEKYGFIGAVKTILSFIKDAVSHIKKLLKHTKVKKVELNLTVGSKDAAQTAIEYGVACTVVYPFAAFLSSYTDIGFKSINVKSDFNSQKSEFNFSAVIRLRVFFLAMGAFRVYKEYKHFLIKENYYERK